MYDDRLLRDVGLMPGAEEAPAGRETRKLEGHAGWVGDVAFAPDDRRIASTGGKDEPFVILWDVATGERLARFSGHSQSVGLLAVSPDGRFAAPADAHGFLRIRRLPASLANAQPRPGARPVRARLQGDGL